MSAVKSEETIVVAAPVMVSPLASICVWISLVTPSNRWNSVSETVPSAILAAEIPVGKEVLVFDKAPK